jgi:hypothetical protein
MNISVIETAFYNSEGSSKVRYMIATYKAVRDLKTFLMYVEVISISRAESFVRSFMCIRK